ncbi:hypothetical protein BZ17_701 [Yersinia pseudotuberculosis IP 32953]|uniref:hypothetical protein n=1 Tax=Yersinia pseudotuberculosis TaxID=633 RepID=UPI000504A8C6|nr:hypothetical protein [Yersinia pseudotuberculosis]AJJ56477.1 hypothetical protein BZ17_701 [Yersinia pseudotuberculosis IP 32953]KGA61190.1 hypothetical protein DJ55_270 [Yersinia pseudotuberculosis]CND86730.1 Uncharacterised protein [Yersinia pseudotuberculosis]CNL86976.1 Uncharacterised protein [Yersinia pseudotuberculosis]SUB30774.1 Uncharacterised protein [Yersinia pseudotuberculosis]
MKKIYLGKVFVPGASTVGYGRVRILSRKEVGHLSFRPIAVAVHWCLSGYITNECVTESFSK